MLFGLIYNLIYSYLIGIDKYIYYIVIPILELIMSYIYE